MPYQEPENELSDQVPDTLRALESLKEELETVDWYNQRLDARKDPDLKASLADNRDEETEHASMLLEWIRRKDATYEKELKDNLFSYRPIAHA